MRGPDVHRRRSPDAPRCPARASSRIPAATSEPSAARRRAGWPRRGPRHRLLDAPTPPAQGSMPAAAAHTDCGAHASAFASASASASGSSRSTARFDAAAARTGGVHAGTGPEPARHRRQAHRRPWTAVKGRASRARAGECAASAAAAGVPASVAAATGIAGGSAGLLTAGALARTRRRRRRGGRGGSGARRSARLGTPRRRSRRAGTRRARAAGSTKRCVRR